MDCEKNTLAKLDLRGCPEEIVITHPEKFRAMEENFFSGWYDPFCIVHRSTAETSSMHRVMIEDGVAVLDHHSPFEIRALFGGDEYWSDITVEAEVRLVACVIDRMDICQVGVVARAASKSCFYLFAIRHDGSVVLECNHFFEKKVLAQTSFRYDKRKYYTLKMACRGDLITCLIDGDTIFSLSDPTHKRGHAGYYSTTRSRLRTITVTGNADQLELAAERRAKAEMDYLKISSGHYRPDCIKTTNLPVEKGLRLFGLWRAKGEHFILGSVATSLFSLDPSGNLLWEIDTTARRGDSSGFDKVFVSPDAKTACATTKHNIYLLDTDDGRFIAETPIVQTNKYGRIKTMGPLILGRVVFADLMSSGSKDCLAVLYGSADLCGFHIDAYDSSLNLLWQQTLPVFAGFTLEADDFHGTGSDYLCTGFVMLNSGGAIVDILREAELKNSYGMREYTIEKAILNSTNVILIDGYNGKTAILSPVDMKISGYLPKGAKGSTIGRYIEDSDGDQIWCVADGKIALSDRNGHIHRVFEPDNVVKDLATVKWPGGDFLLTGGEQEKFGLYDYDGRLVMRLGGITRRYDENRHWVYNFIPVAVYVHLENGGFSIYDDLPLFVSDIDGDGFDEIISYNRLGNEIQIIKGVNNDG